MKHPVAIGLWLCLLAGGCVVGDGDPMSSPDTTAMMTPVSGQVVGDFEGGVLAIAALVEHHQRQQFYGWLSTSTTTTTAPPRPATEVPSPPASQLVEGDGSIWDRLAQCESSGNWAHPPVGPLPGNPSTYSGGLMFDHRYWPGPGLPYQASREYQISVAEDILASNGWRAWRKCSRDLGLR